MAVSGHELALREAAFAHCAELRRAWGDAIPAKVLWRGFPFAGEWVRLYSVQGIHKPKQGALPLTLLTTLDSPYHDELSEDQTNVRYAYSPRDYLNDGVKRAADEGLGFVYLVQVKRKPDPEYLVVSPVFVDHWDDASRTFFLSAVPESVSDLAPVTSLVAEPVPDHERRTALRLVKQRLGQAGFRKEVLRAQRNRCTVCGLRVRPLVDAAHVVPHADPRSTNEVRNGLALCSLHHRAFDTDVLRVDPEAVVHVDEDRLAAFAHTKPATLRRHDPAAMQQLLDHHGRPLRLPKDPARRPAPELLRLRWEAAGPANGAA